MNITGSQVKAARLLLGWSQPKLAAETGVSAATIAKFEEGHQRPSMLDVSVVRRMLNDAGVEFVEGEPGEAAKGQMTITGAQVREARELLGWTRDRLAGASGLSPTTISRLEAGKLLSTARLLSSIRCALEDFGVIFVDENGEGPGCA